MGMARRAPIPPHGTRRRYGHRSSPCRCARCAAANAQYQRRYRHHGRVYGRQLTLDGRAVIRTPNL